MSHPPGQLTLLLRPDEKMPRTAHVPVMGVAKDPGPVMRRVRRFFRPWRLVGKALLVGTPFWLTAAVVTVGGAAAQWVVELFGSSSTMAAAGLGTAGVLSLIPLALLSVWAGLVVGLDLRELGRVRRERRGYDAALARANEPDVLSPADLRRSGVREALKALAHMDGLLASLARDGSPVSGVIRDGIEQSHAMVRRSVLDLIATERRIDEWLGKLGPTSDYVVKLVNRRKALLAGYPGILDQCLLATDHGLSQTGEDPGDLQRDVEQLLDRCRRALAQLDQLQPAVDEQELLLYAARQRERAAAGGAGASLEQP
ncbi:MAG: hypothetical protein AAGH88_05760 [Planctomycetota bacterium]